MENQAQTQRTTFSPFFSDAAPDLELRGSFVARNICQKEGKWGVQIIHKI